MATLTLIDEGALRVLPPDNMTLRLFTNNFYLTHFSVAADFTFDATQDKTLTQSSWTATNNTTYIGLTHTSQVYNFTGAATYYGFAYVLASGYVYFAAKFDTPWTVSNGTSKYITPYIQVSNYTIVPAASLVQSVATGNLLTIGAAPDQIKTLDPSVHYPQNVIIGNLLIQGSTPDQLKTEGVAPSAYIQAVTLGLLNVNGVATDNNKRQTSALVQGVTIGNITTIGSILGNVKSVAVAGALSQGVTGGNLTVAGRTPGNLWAAGSSGTTLTFESGDEGFTFSHSGGSSDIARSATSPITGSYSLRATGTVTSATELYADKTVSVPNGATISLKTKNTMTFDADANGILSVMVLVYYSGAWNEQSMTGSVAETGGVTRTISCTSSGVGTAIRIRVVLEPETFESSPDPTEYIVTIDDISITE